MKDDHILPLAPLTWARPPTLDGVYEGTVTKLKLFFANGHTEILVNPTLFHSKDGRIGLSRHTSFGDHKFILDESGSDEDVLFAGVTPDGTVRYVEITLTGGSSV